MDNVLEMRGITKIFPGVVALDQVDFDLRPGEVHVLLGENGAGKSTLIKILAGAYSPTSGSITIEGQPATIRRPKDALALGVRIIYQELMVNDYITVTENIFHCVSPEKLYFSCPISGQKGILQRECTTICTICQLPLHLYDTKIKSGLIHTKDQKCRFSPPLRRGK